jgi:hypothetical protein
MSTTGDGPSDAQQDRPYSIDLSLELERQLDDEFPSTPADTTRPQSLDPQVLAHIVTNLRSSLAEATRHRDELSLLLSQIQARENDITDTLAHMTDKCSKQQEELDTAKSKAMDDENTISVLRTKVEESRYVTLILRPAQQSPLRPGGVSCASSPRVEGRAMSHRAWISPGLVSQPWRPHSHRNGPRSHPLLARALAGSMRIDAFHLFQTRVSESSTVAHRMAVLVPLALPSPTMQC